MNDINCKDIIEALRADFGSLWHCVAHEKTLEIVTPYLYPDKNFVSVFITIRGKRIIVSESGHVSDFLETASEDVDFQNSILSKFGATYGVSVYPTAKRSYYFTECDSVKLVPSKVFDLCNFIVAVTNASTLATTEEESLDLRSFRAKADRFITRLKVVKDRKVLFNQRLPEIKEATFSAVIRSAGRVWLVSYLTGSSPAYFERSISQSIVNIEFANKSRLKRAIGAIIPFVNNQATGYEPRKFHNRLGRLAEVSGSSIVRWTERRSINDYLTQN
jgi:hypothetical protein